jgi:hypothetical protein
MGNRYDFSTYLNKPVYIETVGDTSISATLTGYNDWGVILSSTEGGHGAERFNARFYPWVAIQYLDLDTTGMEARKSA